MVKANLMPDEAKECRYSYCLNLNKYRILYKVFSLIWNCQHTSPIFSTDIELSNILRVSMSVYLLDGWKFTSQWEFSDTIQTVAASGYLFLIGSQCLYFLAVCCLTRETAEILQ